MASRRTARAPEPLSIRAYARRRKDLGLPGGDPHAVRRAVQEGLIPQSVLTGTGRVKDPDAADAFWAASKRRSCAPLTGPTAPKVGADDEPVDYRAARLRREVAEAEKVEIAVAKLKGELVPAAEVRSHMEADYAAVRTKVLGVPSRLRLADPTLTAEQIEIVRRLVREALEDLAVSGEEAERASA